MEYFYLLVSKHDDIVIIFLITALTHIESNNKKQNTLDKNVYYFNPRNTHSSVSLLLDESEVAQSCCSLEAKTT